MAGLNKHHEQAESKERKMEKTSKKSQQELLPDQAPMQLVTVKHWTYLGHIFCQITQKTINTAQHIITA